MDPSPAVTQSVLGLPGVNYRFAFNASNTSGKQFAQLYTAL